MFEYRKGGIPFSIILVFLFFAACLFLCKFSSVLAGSLSEKISLPSGLKEAVFWQDAGGGKVQCLLCPRKCLIPPGRSGFCRARKNIGGRLYTLTYGRPVALHLDPIEKKPLFHVYPGTRSFSIATAGCNLRCKFCQNWEISQLDPGAVKTGFVSPREVVERAKASGARTIAFTYTEPAIFYEYMLEIAELAGEEGISCVMHSSGFINEKPLRRLAQHLTAANIDLKGFSQKYYSSFCEGNLEDVLRTLKVLKEEKVWVEVTNLVIPSANDSEEDLSGLCLWVKDNLGPDTPVHFSRFFPMYKLADLSPTPVRSLEKAARIAQKAGLRYVYIGNVNRDTGENTYCPVCGKLLIRRRGYTILENNIKKGKCGGCGAVIAGVWD
ncbi:MAG: AmmeMemoRadiSam system radical SAM enzyme [Candidatus Omnitrophica bacterium]|nr:AmmeMemoRadiSam system radical SAM enzyme [Candidatus Omnitrophota bacterium]